MPPILSKGKTIYWAFPIIFRLSIRPICSERLSREFPRGKELEHRLDEVYITVNKNTVPNEPRSPFVTSGVRIGTPAVTTRGLKEADMDQIAEFISLVIQDFEGNADKVRAGVNALCEKYPLY